MGGSPDDRCRSEALFLTAKARSSVMSIYSAGRNAGGAAVQQRASRKRAVAATRCQRSSDYGPRREGVARRARPHRPGGAGRRTGFRDGSARRRSKTQPARRVREAWHMGQRAFGENYVQEAAAKRAAPRRPGRHEMAADRAVAGQQGGRRRRVFDAVESVDRLKIAERLSAARCGRGRAARGARAGQYQRRGVEKRRSPGDAVTLARQVAALPRLRLRGIHGIREPTGDVSVQRAQFATLARA